jgi:MFS transporter, SP family, solute carrier family 2 (myo-inositol transporter), member 13
MHWLPESPRYDLIKGNKDLAIKTLHIVYGSASDEIIEKKLHVMQMSVEVSRRYNLANPGFFRRLREMARVPKYRRPVIVSSMLFLACQLGGVNALVCEYMSDSNLFFGPLTDQSDWADYSATIFAAVGMSNPTAVGILIAATNLFATTVGGLT